MAGTLPCDTYSPGRLQLGGLTWIMFWKKNFLSWRCSFRSNKLAGAYLEVLLEKDLCLRNLCLLILLKSIKHSSTGRTNLMLMRKGQRKDISSALVQGSSPSPVVGSLPCSPEEPDAHRTSREQGEHRTSKDGWAEPLNTPLTSSSP